MMPGDPKIWVFTRAYNAEDTIGAAIESILNQSYKNIEYLIRDNGSTDRTLDICREYAQRDSRLKIVHNVKNHVFESEEDRRALDAERSVHWGAALGENDYFCLLDADDTYLPDFFERAMALAERNNLDIIVCGTEMYDEVSGKVNGRIEHEKNFIISDRDYSDLFPGYFWHCRQSWGKLLRKNVLVGVEEEWTELEKELGEGEQKVHLAYGSDTIVTLCSFRRAERVALLSGIGHRYCVRQKSVSGEYQPDRVDSDWILHRETERYLMDKCGFISEENRKFLAAVYGNAVIDTAHVIHNAAIPKEDKLHEYRRMAEHPVTKENLAFALEETADGRRQILGGALFCRDAQNAAEELPAIFAALSPKCAAAFGGENIPLLELKPALTDALLDDDPEAALQTLLEMLRANEQSKKFDLPAMVAALSADKPLLKDCSERRFLRRYGDIYLAVWREQYASALDAMTGLLLGGEKADETFLQLYLSLAALLGQAEAFVFGKIRFAQLLLRGKRPDECRAILDELTEMGVEDNEEIAALRARLQEKP